MSNSSEKTGRPSLYPPGMPTRKILINIPEELAANLDEYSWNNRMSKSLIIEAALRPVLGKSNLGEGYMHLVVRVEKAEQRAKKLQAVLDSVISLISKLSGESHRIDRALEAYYALLEE